MSAGLNYYCLRCSFQADLEQTTKDIKHQLNEVQTRYDDAVRTLSDLESTKKKLTSDNKSLGRQLEEVEAQVDVLSKLKMSLESEVQDVKNACNEGRLVSLFISFLMGVVFSLLHHTFDFLLLV